MIRRYNAVIAAVLAAFFMAPAQAQNSGSVTNHAFAIGKGAGTTGYTSLLCGSAQLAVGQAAADPICQTITGDVTINASGVTAIGTAKVTSAMMRNSAALSVIGRSANSTGVPGDISCTAASDGVLRESGSVLGCGTIATNGISNNAVTNGKLATMSANTVKGNATGSTAAPTDLAMPSCSTASSALTWTTNTGFGCNSISGGGGGFIYVTPFDYGFTCDGTTDVATDFQAMVDGSVGKTIFIPPGPACVIGTSINLPSGTAITGGGNEASVILSNANPAFHILNSSNVSITDIQILGNNTVVDWTTSSTGPILLEQDSASVAAGANFTFRGLKFAGWNTTYWVQVNTTGSTFTLSNLDISNNYFATDINSVPTGADPFGNQNYLVVFYTNNGGQGRIENTTIDNNRLENGGACFGVGVFGNLYKYSISGNTILQPGTLSPSHCTNALGFTNAYGILVYDSLVDGNPAIGGMITGNTINDSKAIGIYYAGDVNNHTLSGNQSRTVISNNLIMGQSTVDGGTLRGAIVINNSTDISIIGNTLLHNSGCVVLNAIDTGDVAVLNNFCKSGVGSSLGFHLNPGTNGTLNADRRIIRGNVIDVQGTGVLISGSTTTQRHNHIDLSGNNIVATTAIDAASEFFSGTLLVSNNSTSGTTTFSSITGSFALLNNAGMSFTAATLPAANNGSSVFVSDGAPGTACTGGSTGSTAFRQNSAWKCF